MVGKVRPCFPLELDRQMLQSGSYRQDRSPGTVGVLPVLHPEDLTDSLSEVDVGERELSVYTVAFCHLIT